MPLFLLFLGGRVIKRLVRFGEIFIVWLVIEFVICYSDASPTPLPFLPPLPYLLAAARFVI